jgi:hypothetical protein
MIITLACGDGEARSLFKESEIGDTDGDGAPEFLDGWGHPIYMLRWAPGFDSQIELSANSFKTDQDWIAGAAKDHDPLDVYRRDPHAFRLVPLIYSSGRDELPGLVSDIGEVMWKIPPGKSMNLGNGSPYIDPNAALNPYKKVGNPQAYIGTDIHLADPTNFPDETATDNVHNHMLGLR